MTRLFIRFYVGVLAVLFLAWYIHGAVLKRRADADRARVFEEAHGGGARLVASELDAAPPEIRSQLLKSLRGRFDYPIDVIALVDLPGSLQRQISSGDDVAYYRAEENQHFVVAALSSGSEVARLGPFPDFRRREIEARIGGWMRLTVDKLNSTTPGERQVILEQLKEQFDFPIELTSREDLPGGPKERLIGDEKGHGVSGIDRRERYRQQQ